MAQCNRFEDNRIQHSTSSKRHARTIFGDFLENNLGTATGKFVRSRGQKWLISESWCLCWVICISPTAKTTFRRFSRTCWFVLQCVGRVSTLLTLCHLQVPGKMQHVLCTGNVCSKSMDDYLRTLANSVHVVKGDMDNASGVHAYFLMFPRSRLYFCTQACKTCQNRRLSRLAISPLVSATVTRCVCLCVSGAAMCVCVVRLFAPLPRSGVTRCSPVRPFMHDQVVPWGDPESLANLQRTLDVDILVTGHTHKNEVIHCVRACVCGLRVCVLSVHSLELLPSDICGNYPLLALVRSSIQVYEYEGRYIVNPGSITGSYSAHTTYVFLCHD